MITFINKPNRLIVIRLSDAIKNFVQYEKYCIMKSGVEEVKYDPDSDAIRVTMQSGNFHFFSHVLLDPTFKTNNNITDNESLFDYLDSIL